MGIDFPTSSIKVTSQKACNAVTHATTHHAQIQIIFGLEHNLKTTMIETGKNEREPELKNLTPLGLLAAEPK